MLDLETPLVGPRAASDKLGSGVVTCLALKYTLDDQLDRIGPLAASDLAGQPKRQIDAGRHAGGGHYFS